LLWPLENCCTVKEIKLIIKLNLIINALKSDAATVVGAAIQNQFELAFGAGTHSLASIKVSFLRGHLLSRLITYCRVGFSWVTPRGTHGGDGGGSALAQCSEGALDITCPSLL
jgi:hypothetical protein